MISGLFPRQPQSRDPAELASLRIGLLLAFACAFSAAGAVDTPEPQSLLSQLARPEPSEVRFFERRTSAVLIEPIYSHGHMRRPAPGVLEKTVDSEPSQSMRIADGRVEVRTPEQPTRRFSLNRAPGLGLLAQSFDALLSGNAALIADQYSAKTEGDIDAWRMTLTPINSRLARRVAKLVLAGGGGEWRCFDMEMGDGERSRLWLGEAAKLAQRQDTDAERDALCAPTAAR